MDKHFKKELEKITTKDCYRVNGYPKDYFDFIIDKSLTQKTLL